MNKNFLWLPLIAMASVFTGCATTTVGGESGLIKQTENTFEYRLNNGLRLIVREDRRAPIVVSQIWYKVGASYEYNGITGVSHVLEHMMFKGTEKLGPNEFSRIIASHGGKENAFTGADYTAYFQRLEKSRLAVSFELEADRMRNLMLNEAEFRKEVEVVMEERRMRTEDKPTSFTYEQFKATAFVNSPYHHPIIGWMDDLKHMELNDLQQWYEQWYAPNNATLVVAGDISASEVFLLAKKHFGPLKPEITPTIKPQKEITQNGIKRITVKRPAELPYLLMGYQAPSLKTAEQEWEVYALDMLASVLDGGDSARLSKELIRGNQIATSAGAGYNLTSRLDDLFMFDGMPAQGKTVDDLEKAIRQQIKRVQTELVDEKELQRIKAQVKASKIYERDSIFYQAMQIGTMATIGLDWQLMDSYLEKLEAITPEQIRQVANKYLVDDALTVATLEPLPLDNKKGGQRAH